MASKDQNKNPSELTDSNDTELTKNRHIPKHNLKPVDVQRQQLEKLLQRADKP
ncbi:4331_t:CDS:1, partial [Cetraspora pellucida]